MFEVNNKDLIVNFEHISYLSLVLPIVDFEKVNVCWARQLPWANIFSYSIKKH